MSTKTAEDIRTQALRNMQKLSRIITRMVLEEKSMSKQTHRTVMESMGKMNWEDKDRYANELITILKTSKTEQEIIQRAEKARKELNVR